MSEQTTTTEPAEKEEAKQEPQEGADAKTFDEAYVKKLRDEAAKYRTEAKANAEAAKRLADIEEAQKSEAEKTAERLTAAEKRAAEAETGLARFQVALEKGLTPSQAKRLVGATKEELAADADELLADLADSSKPRQPRPDPTQGRPTGAAPLDPKAADLAQIEADLAAAKRG